MKIEHIALWSHDIEKLKAFYQRYFDATANDKYINAGKGFESYFLCFDSGARLELMQMPGIPDNKNDVMDQATGFIHIAMCVGSKEKVDELTGQLELDGYPIIGKPRTTGDGYYESVILDPDDNRIEITE